MQQRRRLRHKEAGRKGEKQRRLPGRRNKPAAEKIKVLQRAPREGREAEGSLGRVSPHYA